MSANNPQNWLDISDPTGLNPARDEADEHIPDDDEDEGARPAPMARSPRAG